MNDLVSVVVPCFNYGRHLPDCIRSLGAQTHTEWECVIVDDGSTDDTPAVCERLAESDGRVRFLRQQNRGVNAARNAGLALARGEYIQFLDADDMLQRDKLRAQVRYLQAHLQTDIVLGEAAFFDSSSPNRLRRRRRSGATGATARIDGSGLPVIREFVYGNVSVIHAALVRRKVFEAVGLLDEGMRLNEDWEFWLRCALSGRRFSFVSTGEDRALVREHDSSPSRAREPMLRATIYLRDRIDTSIPEELRLLNAQLLAEAKGRLGIELVRQGKAAEGWVLYRNAIRASSSKARLLAQTARLLPGADRIAALSRRFFSGLGSR